MDKEEFLKEKYRINDAIRNLNDLSDEMTKNYIAKHRELVNGEKVKVTFNNNTDYVFVVNAYECNGEIRYDFVKCKKDGTPSQHSYSAWWRYESLIIEKLPEAVDGK